MAYFIILLVLSVAVLMQSASSTENSTPSSKCDPGYEQCSLCYNVLANELIVSDRNRFNLQNAFFPPESTNPVFVTVRYRFIRNSTGQTNFSADGPVQLWFWTESTFYLFQPIESLQFTSLLFADTILSGTNTLDLYLQPECKESSTRMMRLLTQRVSDELMNSKCHCTYPNNPYLLFSCYV